MLEHRWRQNLADGHFATGLSMRIDISVGIEQDLVYSIIARIGLLDRGRVLLFTIEMPSHCPSAPPQNIVACLANGGVAANA
jgi:hypothetical protein